MGLYKPPIRTNNNPKREKVGSNSNVIKNGKKERDNNKKIFKAKPHIVPNGSVSKSEIKSKITNAETDIIDEILDSFDEKELQSENDLRKKIAEILAEEGYLTKKNSRNI